MKLQEAFELTVLGKTRLVAGSGGLQREVRWVHIVDMPDILPWVGPGQLLLTTGYAWPREEANQRNLMRSLAEQNLAGIGLAVPRFFDHFPSVFCEEADRLGFPLLEIPWEIPFAQITQELHAAILAEQTRLIEQSELIHRSLTRIALEADNLHDIAQTLGDLIHHSVTFEDQEGRVLGAFTIPGTEDHVRRESLAQGVTPQDFLDYLDYSGYRAQIDSTTTPMRLPPAPDMGFVGRIMCPIRLKGEIVGRVWIIEGSAPLSELELRAAEHAAIIAALHITHQRAIASVEARVGYSFLTAILEGRFEATPQTLERARLQGLNLDGCYRVGLFVMNEQLPLSRDAVLKRERFADQLRQQLYALNIAPLISVSLNQVQFLVPNTADVQIIWNRLARPDMAVGISRAYQGIDGIRRAYLEVLDMLPHLQFSTFQRYEDLLLPRVLRGDAEAQQAFLDGLFSPLQSRKSGDVLMQSLVCFAQSGFSLKQTAETLHIHPKSLRYRLMRAAEFCNLDLHDPDTRFRLQLATRILELLKA